MDLYNELKISRALSPVAATIDNTAYVTQILDTANFAHHCLALMIGTLADVDVTAVVLLEESNDSGMSGATAVADADLLGTELLAGFQFDDDNETRKLGYKGSKRYIRATITPAANSGNFFLAGVWIQAGAHKGPQA